MGTDGSFSQRIISACMGMLRDGTIIQYVRQDEDHICLYGYAASSNDPLIIDNTNGDHICLYGYAASALSTVPVAAFIPIISACMGMLRVLFLDFRLNSAIDHICLYGYAASPVWLLAYNSSYGSYLLVWVCCEKHDIIPVKAESRSYLLVWVCCECICPYYNT